ncbi:penicillin-binding transpeptidase domain-containing protein [uncultured Dysosmobacter sp.]|uniref:penicillin-binding transpeptidase domain-containing protein n=1 Tax=uncultured Dysosmobacter sp. TaxID=2591384 RepID=UPI00267244AD|nr:penicillin-binding transpeptidase domain-containing protein [uncultured Dysosmobacter sp.]
MNQRPSQLTRFRVMAAMALAVLAIYLVVLFNTQVVHHEEYLAKSIQTITRMENVEASRGIITDRSGRTLVTNQSTYSLTFDASLLKPGENQNDAILRLVTLCRDQGVAWEDNLPLSLDGAAHFTVDTLTDTQKSRFFSYLRDLKPTRELLAAYVRQHPELLKPPKEGETALDPATAKDTELLKQTNSAALTNSLLLNAGVTPAKLFDWMREDMKLSDDYSDSDARLILGVRYELKLRKLGANNNAYVLAQNLDVAFCSLISDGQFQGAKIIRSSARQYATTYATHILGTVGRIPDYTDEWEDRGYLMDDTIGLSGAEAAFEDYLRGTDGKRMISVNSDGKVTGEYYSVEPRSGYTVELTVDLKLQQAVEDTLAVKVAQLNQKDHLDSRGAAAAVVKVGTGEILSLASYPTFDLSTWRQDYAELSSDPATPMLNRAASSAYAPGSTLKPATAVAALESGATTPSETLFDTGYWKYPSTTWNGGTWCWKHSGHGKVNATTAITNSCNYYFAEMGYRMGLDTLNEYYSALGLGEPTGIEIGEKTGRQATNEGGSNQAPWAAYGQADQLYTPLQLANYIATLVSGGQHCPAHLLKSVKSYDNSEIIATGDTTPLNTLNISDSTLQAVKKGMYGYTQPGGMVYSYFKDCIVSAGAKTGTAQLGGGLKNNGVFVAFAPYDDPEIAIALVLEKGDAGAALATTAVDIINAYFDREDTASILPENQLIP